MKDLKISTFYIKLIDDRRKTKQENIESLDLTQKLNLLELWRGKEFCQVRNKNSY